MKLQSTGRERALMLKFKNLPRSLHHKFNLALPRGSNLQLDLDVEELDSLAQSTVQAFDQIQNPKSKRAIIALLKKVIEASGVLPEPGSDDPQSFINPMPGPEDQAERIIQQARKTIPGWDSMDFKSQLEVLTKTHEFENMEQLQRLGNHLIAQKNEAPLAEFQGLSPRQMHLLLSEKWTDGTPGVQLRKDVPDEQVRSTDIIRYSRAFLAALIKAEGTKATAKGNLNRKFISQMVEKMGMPEDYIQNLFRHHKVLNERDVRILEELRLTLEMGKLIRKYRGKFVTTKLGRQLLEAGNLGELFALLFHTKFRVFNLAYGDGLPDFYDFQHLLGYSLYRLSSMAVGQWYDLPREAPGLMHPDLAAVVPDNGVYDLHTMLVLCRLLNPLAGFGLVELDHDQELGLPAYYSPVSRFRTTPLLNQLVSFDLK